ncbi:MAG: tetratricopeptide repeat protein [Anaerolineae bacterium]|nr:tetratricopeptide repeat protein [Anaerolineae bacterium]
MFDQDQSVLPILSHRYRLQEELGAGGMGIVYRAYDRLNGQTVAVKLINVPPEYFEFMSRATSANLLVPLAREFQTLASLRHPNIISVLDYGFAGEGQPFLVMELIEHARELSAAGSDQAVDVQMGLIGQVLQALKYLHRHGIVHCDLKPGNVLVTEQGAARVLDFGLALRHGQAADGGGTLGYMSPEVLAGGRATPLSDLYAVGVMAYELLTGKLPHYLASLDGMVQAILKAPADLDPIPEEWRGFVGRLLEKEPGARYASAGEALAALQAAMGQPETESVSIRESYLQAAPFVGRERELAELSNALNSAKEGQGSSWLVGGESGVGKSRLLDELRTQAQVEGFQVLRGQAVEGGGLPYQLWREPLRRLALTVEMSDLEAGILKPVVPDMAALLERDIPDAPELTGEAGQQRLALTILDVFMRQSNPLLLLLEDLQWSQESLEPLKRLNGMCGELPLQVVANYRSDERPHLPDELSDMQAMLLERLSADEVAELSAGMLGEGGRDPVIVERLQQETEGNTFFMVEVVRALAEAAGRLGDIGQMTLPRSILAGGIQKIVRRRLERVPDWGQGLLRLAAVAGRQLDQPVIEALVGANRALLPNHTVSEWLQVCGDAFVLDIQDERWRFAHDKLREGLLVGMDPAETKLVHRSVAKVIESVHPDQPIYAQTLFDHWYAAGNIAKSVHYARQAAEQMQTRGAYRDAILLADQVLDNLRDVDQDARMWLLKIKGDALKSLAEYPLARMCYEESMALARQAQDDHGIFQCLVGLHNIERTLAEVDTARLHLDEAYALALKLNDDKTTARVLHALGELYGDSDFARARDYSQRALLLFEKLADLQGQANCRLSLGGITGALREVETSRIHLETALRLSREVGHSDGIFNSLNSLANLVRDDDPAAAELHYREAIEIAQRTGDRLGGAIALVNLANMREDQGDNRGGLTYQQQALAIFQAVGAKAATGVALLNIAMSHYELGDYALSEAHLHEALTHLRLVEQDMPGYIAGALYCLAEVLLAVGQTSEARKYAEDALQQAQVTNEPFFIANAYSHLAAVETEAGNLAAARSHFDQSLTVYEDNEFTLDKITALIGLGQIALLESNPDAAKQSFSDSLAIAHSFSSHLGIAMCSAWVAEAEVALQRPEAARLCLHKAIEHASNIESQRVHTHILALCAWLNELEGQPEESAGLLGFLLRHPATEAFTRRRLLIPLRERLEGRLGALFQNAMMRGEGQSLAEALALARAAFSMPQ